ncbi:hypothetical protein HNP38_001393 [Chryseobacterium defluvii]|uniref:Uncharacterized protein n=1 Tax=Chryseobacterium defluvii TaxID=160396 RepID=A0A840K9J1_9FLAO|nr:hypothetical protein [Chryseobacterium defluvii]MBB4806121.1 hypothetical protein [Chryseobacterium defluvii]
MLNHPMLGWGGEESKIYNYFKKLSETASNDELYFFARHGSNSLRIYSSEELLRRNDKRFLNIYKFYSEDPLFITYHMGCNGSRKDMTQLLKNEIF